MFRSNFPALGFKNSRPAPNAVDTCDGRNSTAPLRRGKVALRRKSTTVGAEPTRPFHRGLQQRRSRRHDIWRFFKYQNGFRQL